MACKVLIVGAGPVGLTAACELVRRGLDVRLVDEKAHPSRHSKALGVMPRTLELLEKLDLAGSFVDEGKPLERINIYDHRRRIARASVAPLDTPYPFILSLPQSRTEALLVGRLRALGGRVEWETRCTRLDVQENGVHVTLASDDEREELTAEWVLACDGAHSFVREALNIDFSGDQVPGSWVLADAPLQADLPPGEVCAFLTPAGPLALFPLPDGQLVRLIGLFSGKDSKAPVLTRGIFQRLFDERAPVPGRVGEPVWTSSFQIARRLVPTYRRGRVLLAGDAAHVHSPVGGQGMNTGMQDAFNLSWKLALVQQGHAAPSLLDSYEAERRPVGRATLQGTHVATWVVSLRSRWLTRLRSLLVPLLLGTEPIRRYLLSTLAMLRVGYTDSPIVAEDSPSLLDRTLKLAVPRSAGPSAGARATDVSLVNAEGRPRRLFDLMRSPRHFVLVLTGSSLHRAVLDDLASLAVRHRHLLDCCLVTTGKRVSARDEVPVYRDPMGEAHRRYGGSMAGYVIRPDGYVGWRGHPFRFKDVGKWLVGWSGEKP